MLQRFFLLLTLILSTTTQLSARTISAQTALERALLSATQSGDAQHSQALRANYTLAYSSPTGSYHVFNRRAGGYLIASGDDEIYPVLADVPSGSFVRNDLAPATKWLLDSYDSQIRSFSTNGESDPGLADYYNNWSEIPPLMTTQWNQAYPYNKYCPTEGGRTCMTGCVATAMAQVVRCIGYYSGSGYKIHSGTNYAGNKVEFDYSSATFDFDNMFDVYPSAASQESLDQVGQLMLACGLAVGMGYGVSESGAYSESVPLALIEHFGYDSQHTQIYYCENFTQAQWENMLYRQLQLDRPVYYSGSGKVAAHAFVIDGYRPAGLYHVNWGWGGVSDGYFRLSALNPSQIGTGGSSGGYNIGQEMVCAVPPDTDPGIVFGEMSGSISMVSEGVYSLYYKSNGHNLFDTNIGALIVDSLGHVITSATFWQKQNITASSAIRHDSFTYDFSQHPLSPGHYHIYPAFQRNGEEYVIADALHDRQHSVNLIVSADGKYIVSNSDTTTPAEADIHIADIVDGYDLREGFSGSIGFYAVNNGNADYKGTFRLSLLNDDDGELATTTSQKVTVAAGTNTAIYCPMPVFDNSNKLISAGTYRLRFTDGNHKILSDGKLSIEIKNGTPFSEWEPDENIEVTNSHSVPAKLLCGELWPHTPLIYTTQTNRNMTLRLAFYNPQGTSAAHTLLCYQGTIEPMQSLFPLDPIAVDVPFGSYEFCYRKGYGQISQRCPIRIGVAEDGIGYYPVPQNGVSASLTQDSRNIEELVIPSKIKIDGTNREVTAIEPEAFMSARNLSVVDLPPGISKIGANAFTVCPSLRQVIMRSEEPPFSLRNHIAPGLDAAAEFYVPATAYEAYDSLLRAYNPVYAIVESIESKETEITTYTDTLTLTVFPAHDAVNPAFSITPADNFSASVASVRILSVEPGSLTLEVEAFQEGQATFHISPAHRSDDPAVLRLTIPELTAVDRVPTAPQQRSDTTYDMLGRRCKSQNSTGRPLLRIIKGADGKTRKVLR